MIGERQVAQEALFYEFSLDRYVPDDHWVRAIDRLVDLFKIHVHLRPFYREMGRGERVLAIVRQCRLQ